MCTQNSECKNTCNNCGFLLRRKSNYGGADSSNIYCDKDKVISTINKHNSEKILKRNN